MKSTDKATRRTVLCYLGSSPRALLFSKSCQYPSKAVQDGLCKVGIASEPVIPVTDTDAMHAVLTTSATTARWVGY